MCPFISIFYKIFITKKALCVFGHTGFLCWLWLLFLTFVPMTKPYSLSGINPLSCSFTLGFAQLLHLWELSSEKPPLPHQRLCHAGGVNPPPSLSLQTAGGNPKREQKKTQTLTSHDVRPWPLFADSPPTAPHFSAHSLAALLSLPEGGQPGLGEGEETTTAWRAA